MSAANMLECGWVWEGLAFDPGLEPTVYGVISNVHGVRVGINIYLEGFIPDENVRFRKEPIVFHVKPPTVAWETGKTVLKWEDLGKSFEGFSLEAEAGEVKSGEVIGILGPNGIGKTTFVKLLAGLEKPDKDSKAISREFSVSYKPQYLESEAEELTASVLKNAVKKYKAQIIKVLPEQNYINS